MNHRFAKTALVVALAATTLAAQAAELEEIIVTAQKRAESLQDVPISVDVVQADDLKKLSINNAQDLAMTTPSLVFQKGGMPFANNFVIRGIGSMAFEGGIQPSVSFVVDGVPLARISEFSADLGDIERVEILRGPQGTLYGRNATGGAVNIVRAEPTADTEGYVQQTLTSDEEYTTRLMYNTALNDKVNMRLSGFNTDRDDYIENVIDGNPDLGGEKTFGVMGKFGINIDDATDLLITADYRKMDSSEGAQHVDVVESGTGIDPRTTLIPTLGGGLTYDEIGAIRLGALGGGNAALGQRVVDDPFKTSQDHEQQANMEAYGISFDLTKALSDDLTLKSITAYRNSASYSSIDVDNTAANAVENYDLGLVALIDTTVSPRDHDELIANEIHYFSQEIRFEGTTDNMEWIAGGYYSQMEEVADNTAPLALFDNFLLMADPKEATAQWDSYAIFGDMTFNITDTFDIFTGLRWTQEDMDIDYKTSVYQIAGVPFFPAGTVTYGEEYTEFNTAFASVSSRAFERSDRSADWSGRVGFAWDFADDAQLYASASRGFVGAGANIGRSATEANAVVAPSTTQSYEMGIKSRLFDNSVQLNTAVFWQEVTDLQTSRVVPGSVNTETFNAGVLVTQGVEVTADWAATDILTLTANISYLDTEIDDLLQPCYPGQTAGEGCNVDNGGGVLVQDVSGNDMILAPELSYNLQSRLDIPLASMPFDMFALASYTWRDDTIMTLEYDPLLVQEDYGILDLSIGIEDKQSAWSVMMFGKNVTDEYFASSMTASNGYSGQGRVLSRTSRGAQAYWGLTAKYNF
jgi:iron complex outermembrane receptor protein